jgi:hypothetical protein
MADDTAKQLTEPERETGEVTPVETPLSENTEQLESIENTGTEDVLAALGAVDVGDEPDIETPDTKAVTGKQVDEKISDEARQFKAKVEAAVATGGIATGLEKLLSPVVITDEMREDFHEALIPVLLNYGGGVTPDWIAKILEDWKAEINLARKTVCIGWAIWEQHQDIKSGLIVPEKRKKRYRLPASETTKKAEKVAA